MPDDVNVRIEDSIEHPLCDFLARLSQGGMQRGQHQIKACQEFVRVVQLAIGFDLNFRSVQNNDAIAKFLLNLLDLGCLFLVIRDA